MRRNSIGLTSLLLLGALSGITQAQSPTLVRDFTPGSSLTGGDASPGGFALQGGNLFFAANTVSRGRELYRSVGGTAPPVLVRDIVPGPDSSFPGPFAALGTKVYFGSGAGLWTSDGSEPGTTEVATMKSAIVTIQSDGTRLFYRTASNNLWISDGTSAGTQRLNTSSQVVPENFALAGGRAFFIVQTPSAIRELWVTDGTLANTRRATTKSLSPMRIAAFGNRVIVAGRNPARSELWVADGTDPGTILLPTPSFVSVGFNLGTNHLFAALDVSKMILFKTDGTVAGTQRITEIPTTFIRGLEGMSTGGLGYFTSLGEGLFVTDGTAAGTRRLFTGSADNITLLRGDSVVFAGTDSRIGRELYTSDGTLAGTVLVRDINPGLPSSELGSMTHVGPGQVVFGARHPALGVEPMLTDGTAGGTRVLGDIQPGVRTPLSSNPQSRGSSLGVTTVSTRLLGNEIYVSDGTGLGTAQVADGLPRGIRSLDGSNFLLVDTTTSTDLVQLSRTGPIPVISGPGSRIRTELMRAGKHLVFSGPSHTALASMWSSDGTAVGTQPLPLRNGDELIPLRAFPIQNRVMVFGFRALPGSQQSLFITDGTRHGTVELHAARGASDAAALDQRAIVAVTGGLLVTDGTPAGTRLLNPPQALTPQFLLASGDHVYFLSQSFASFQLWKTDGTDQGTQMVFASNSGQLVPLGTAGGRVVFQATQPSTGRELWSTDGTAAGTALLRDITPGRLGQPPLRGSGVAVGAYQVVGESMYFRAEGPTTGSELWVTDGTPSGTRIVVDQVPDKTGSTPADLVLVNGRLVYSALDPVAGRELFSLEVGAHTQPIGFGCSRGMQPVLQSSPPQLGSTVDITLQHGPGAGQSAVVLFGDIAASPTPWISGCAVYIDLVQFTFAETLTIDSQGEAAIRAQIPSDPSLHGVGLGAQAGIALPGAPAGLELSAGLRLELRR